MAKRHTAAAAACLLLAGCLVWAGRKRTVTYLPDESAFPNAQIGYAPGVLDSGTEGATLRYLGLTWRQLEPEEGAYAWEAIEQTCHLAELRAQGVHLVLRISCDEPGDEAHLDIPDWLYEQTGTGRWYDIAYGKGYAPDYTADPICGLEEHHHTVNCRAAAAGGGGAAGGRRFRQLCGAGEPRPLGRVARQVRGGASLHAR